MKVSNENLKMLDDKIRKKIDLKEQELEKINKIYDARIKDANVQGDVKYVDSLDRNKHKIILANKEYEEKLQSYQDSLQERKDHLESEENKIQDISNDKLISLKSAGDEKYSSLYEKTKDNQEALFKKSQNDSAQLDIKSRHEKLSHEGRARQDLASFSSALTQNTKEQEENLKAQLETEQAAMARSLIENKMGTQSRLLESKEKNKRLENEQTRVQNNQMQFLDQYHNELMKQKESDFQVRYQQLSTEHDNILKTLSAKLQKSTNEAIEANIKEKTTITDQAEDPFYRLEILKPKIKEDSKFYYVNLEVAPHEKEDVHLMAHGREIRITMSKKFSTSLEGPDGSTNRTSKTQLYSKDFPTQDIVNSKQIAQKYENGILSFKVAKL